LAFWYKFKGKDTFIEGVIGLLKKNQKTPSKEIKKAEDIRIPYLEFKKK
jgi:hypothetical protein